MFIIKQLPVQLCLVSLRMALRLCNTGSPRHDKNRSRIILSGASSSLQPLARLRAVIVHVDKARRLAGKSVDVALQSAMSVIPPFAIQSCRLFKMQNWDLPGVQDCQDLITLPENLPKAGYSHFGHYIAYVRCAGDSQGLGCCLCSRSPYPTQDQR